MTGILFGVGVGPGDPELLTFKAAKILQSVAVIAYTVDEAANSLARQIAEAHIPASAVELPLRFSMSPNLEDRRAARKEAARLVLEALSRGLDVAFITEGDPLLYSTFQHLLAEMPPWLQVEICPGVSAFTAAAAAAHAPLALEDQQMLITTGKQLLGAGEGANWTECRQQFDVIVIYKIHRYLDRLIQELERIDCLDQAVLVERASQPGQVVMRRLAQRDGRTPNYFSIVLLYGCGRKGEDR
jgi:precorrin-2/cobalt-factor-2 C20-methyltransferase